MMIDLSPMLACLPVMGMAAMMKMSMLISGIGAAATFIGQQQQAKDRQNYQDHLADLQRQAGQRKSAALVAKNIQTGEAVARKKFEVSKAGSKASSQAALSAIEGGVSGMSIEYLTDEYEAQEGAYMFALTEEQRLRDVELGRTLDEVALSTHSQMVATQAPVNFPSALAATMDFAGSALGDYQAHRRWKGGAED